MGCCESIEESNVGVIEACGKFDYLASNYLLFFVDIKDSLKYL
jgi:hypothetical protein